MSAIRKSGKTKVMYFPKKASTVITEGNFVIFASGKITNHAGDATEIVGVARRTTASGDSDYASNTMFPVEVPLEPYVEWNVLATGTAVAADVGLYIDIATTDAGTADRSTSSDDVLLVTRFLTATKLYVVINKLACYSGS